MWRLIRAQWNALQKLASRLSPVLAESKVIARQACFRPVTLDGLPLIGAIAGVPGAYVATGHSVWGILNAPATGEAMAELIMRGAAQHVDLSPFAPGRFPALDRTDLQAALGKGREVARRRAVT
jgi:glycine/D-amino acid oxidase-like deaminating enzyme